MITHGASSNAITMKPNGDIEINASTANIDAICSTMTATCSVKAHLNAPSTDLSDTSTSPVIKGTEFNAAVATLHSQWTAFLASLIPVQAEWASFASSGLPWIPVTGTQSALATALAALTAAITAYAGQVAGFTSVKTKTG